MFFTVRGLGNRMIKKLTAPPYPIKLKRILFKHMFPRLVESTNLTNQNLV